MNKGLSQILIEAIPNIMPVDRPKIETTEIPDPNWIAGFSTAESCFDVNITKQKNNEKKQFFNASILGFSGRLFTSFIFLLRFLKFLLSFIVCPCGSNKKLL